MSSGNQLLGIGSHAILKSCRERVLRIRERSTRGGDGSFPALEIPLPYGRCFPFHVSFLSWVCLDLRHEWLEFPVDAKPQNLWSRNRARIAITLSPTRSLCGNRSTF